MERDEIDNTAIRRLIDAGETTEDLVFMHRYNGGQIDYGITDGDGSYWAWYGGDYEEEVDYNELEIVKPGRPDARRG